MKKYSIITLLSFAYILGSCTQDTILEDVDTIDVSAEAAVVEEVKQSKLSSRQLFSSASDYEYSEIIIRYKGDVSEQERTAIRERHEVISYKKCNCADQSLELWRFQTDKDLGPIGEEDWILDIERRRAQAKADPGLEGTDFNFMVTVDDDINDDPASEEIPDDKIVSSNTGVTVAVLDTGLDYEYEGFKRPFIYNSVASGTNGIDGDYMDTFGWDLVNQDNNPADDNGHGTVITYLITNSLEKRGIHDYQILPIKIADSEGKASFFDLLCGFKYALSKPEVNVINISLGWYGEASHFFSEFIQQAFEKNILIVTSAGNSSSNNDRTPHFPSSYPDANVISIAGMNRNMTALASYSNYGRRSVDFAAPSQNIRFSVDGNTHLVSGTSFASAYATGRVAVLRSKGVAPGNVVSRMASKAIYKRSLYNRVKSSSYIPAPRRKNKRRVRG